MKVPLEWLKDFINIELPPIEIAKILTQMGLEVDAIHTIEPEFTNIVVGEILESEKHPNADKLSIAKVTDGIDTFQVVCGAPNCRKGIKTAFAKLGATLPESEEKIFKVKKSKIRGIESEGMLCSFQELKISDENEGIIEFDLALPLGKNVADLFKQTIFEISLTPNLGHCGNILGVARELCAALELTELKCPNFNIEEDNSLNIEDFLKVSIINTHQCLKYSCRIIRDVVIGPSPLWLQNRLLASGLRPINNIVDITNYVLMELGQPLHAFDYDLISGKEIIVRSAEPNEKIVTLDGKERSLSSQDLLISDSEKPLAIAGIMGGNSSEVSQDTHHIILESAYFLPTAIRKTSKNLGLMTDASKRFERGCDPNMVNKALDRAAMLMKEIAQGNIVSGVIDISQKKFEEKKILCRVNRINKLLGTQLSINEVENIFKRLGFQYLWDHKDTFTVIVPTYRVDINYEVDLIEEVARIYGFENLRISTPLLHTSKLLNSEVFLFEREIRARMISEGLQEFLTCDLIGPTLLDITQGLVSDENILVKVLNPVSIEQSYLRTSLLPGLLQVVKTNNDYQNFNISGFEIGKVHFKEDHEKFKEETVLGIILTGLKYPDFWQEANRKVDFYDLKGIVENLLNEQGIRNYTCINNNIACFHSGRQASFYVDSIEIGSIGELHPLILRKLDITERIYYGEFNLEDVFSKQQQNILMQKISKYPSSERDWTITLDEEFSFNRLKDLVHSIKSELLEDFQLRDIYRSSKLGEGLKNMTLRFIYRDNIKTISQEDVDKEHTRITDMIRSRLTL